MFYTGLRIKIIKLPYNYSFSDIRVPLWSVGHAQPGPDGHYGISNFPSLDQTPNSNERNNFSYL